MNEPIAIIGRGCRLAGGVPPDRNSASRHSTSTRGYFLSQDVREFDASFFSLSPLEAQAMDPQHRLLLETVYEALEEAGIPAETLRGSDTAVYTGVMFHDYLSLSSQDHMAIPKYHITGTAPNKASNRISYFFDWHGPSVTVDTACSSSLVALDHAVQQLRSGSSTLAVAAGANLLLDGRPFIGFNNMGMLSPTGSCKMWDTEADGYARGEGILAMLLKPLRLALADGDNIQCVIRETGVNHNGRTSGITLPSASAQTSLIRDVYHRAGLDPTNPSDRPQYIEAHGTGTQAGDPLEAEALAAAFSLTSSQPDEAHMLVGSIKTVIGHTEGAAGLAGVLKASLAIQHGIIPPNLGFQQLNKKVAPYCTNMDVVTSVQPWPAMASNTPRRVSINSFGFGGANAHVILESVPLPAKNGCQEASLSPRSDSLTTTLASHRSLLPVRVRFPASSIESLQQAINSSFESGVIGYQSPLKESKILGIFTGQGAQWAQMGVGLLAAHPSLISFLDDLDKALQSLPEGDRPTWSLREELERPSEESRIDTPEICQPICTAIQLMLGHLLQKSCGISFSAVVGHSSGEIAAAYFAGFFTLS
ncbi:hybrid nrps pks [Botrytis cinerea]